MMTAVRLTSSSGSQLMLTLGDISEGVTVQEIGGLEPVKANIVSSSFPNVQGEQYMSSQREARDITFKLGLEPDYISEYPSDVRDRLYEYFMPNTWVTLEFFDSIKDPVNISGMTETFDAPLFVKEPVANISVRCFDSDFVNPDVVMDSYTTVSNTLDTTISYDGTVESGVILQIYPDRDVDAFTVYHTLPNGDLRQLDFSLQLHSADIVRIDSIPGEKEISLTRAGVKTPVLYAMSPTSSWIEFFKGDNKFRVYAEGAPIPYDLTYYKRYGGR